MANELHQDSLEAQVLREEIDEVNDWFDEIEPRLMESMRKPLRIEYYKAKNKIMMNYLVDSYKLDEPRFIARLTAAKIEVQETMKAVVQHMLERYEIGD